jgi:hypothetical protein
MSEPTTSNEVNVDTKIVESSENEQTSPNTETNNEQTPIDSNNENQTEISTSDSTEKEAEQQPIDSNNENQTEISASDSTEKEAEQQPIDSNNENQTEISASDSTGEEAEQQPNIQDTDQPTTNQNINKKPHVILKNKNKRNIKPKLANKDKNSNPTRKDDSHTQHSGRKYNIPPIVGVARKLNLLTSEKDLKACCLSTCHLNYQDSIDLNASKGTFNCKYCGKRGNTIDLVREHLGVTPRKANEIIRSASSDAKAYVKEYNINQTIRSASGGDLDKQLTIQLSSQVLKDIKHETKVQLKHKDQRQEQEDAGDRSKLFKTGLVQKIYSTFHELCAPVTRIKLGLSIFNDRKLDLNELDARGIRYLDNYHKIDEELRKRFTVDNLRNSGLFGPLRDEENRIKIGLSFYYHKLIFPFFNGQNIIYIEGRRFNDDEPVTINTDAKATLIYNYQAWKQKDNKPLCITNGILNTLELIDNGLRACGIVGAKDFKRDWYEQLKDVDVVLCYDNIQDEIPQKIAKELAKIGNPPRIANLKQVIKNPKKVNKFPKYGTKNNEDEPFWRTGKV